jgi:hypothetical protein
VVAAAAGLLVLVGGGALYLVTRGGSTPTPTAAPSPPEATAAPPSTASQGPTGTLVVDALPWGEVVSVVDAQGARQASAGPRYTPVALQLPPGEYTVEIRNPGFPKAVSVKARVRAAAVETRVAEFRRVDATAYFRKAGLAP